MASADSPSVAAQGPEPFEGTRTLFTKPAKFAAAGFLSCLGTVLFADLHESKALEWLWWTVIGLLPILGLPLGFMLAWRFLQPDRFKLRIDAEGIHDFAQRLHIPWSEVRDLRLYDHKLDAARAPGVAFHLLLLTVRDPSRYADGAWRRLMWRLARRNYGADLAIDLTGLDVPPATVEGAAHAYWKRDRPT